MRRSSGGPARLESDLADNYFSVTLSAERSAALAGLAQALGIGLDHLLLFSFHLFLFRVTRNETVLTAYCHRIRVGSPDQIGFNENKPVFKSLLVPEQSVAGFFRQAARLLAQAQFHSDIPSREVIGELLRLNPDYRWPTNILFDEDTLPYRELALDGVTATLLPFFSHRLESEDFAIYFDLRDRIAFHALARSPQDISGLNLAFAHYLALLDHLDEDLERPVAAVPASSRNRCNSRRWPSPMAAPCSRRRSMCSPNSPPSLPAARTPRRSVSARST